MGVECNKAVFHNTTPDVQDQDEEQYRFFWSEIGLVLRPTVSDHITAGRSGLAVACLTAVREVLGSNRAVGSCANSAFYLPWDGK